MSGAVALLRKGAQLNAASLTADMPVEGDPLLFVHRWQVDRYAEFLEEWDARWVQSETDLEGLAKFLEQNIDQRLTEVRAEVAR